MALIVEDGTGLADAESYISVADASTYHTARGNAAWAALASDTVREQLLRKATEYMVQVYRLRWMGTRFSTTQALDWPRYDVPIPDAPGNSSDWYIDTDVVPQAVKNACAELALKASSAELAPDLDQRVKREKIDVIEVEYAEHGPQYTTYRAIDNMLSPFLTNIGASRKVIRA